MSGGTLIDGRESYLGDEYGDETFFDTDIRFFGFCVTVEAKGILKQELCIYSKSKH